MAFLYNGMKRWLGHRCGSIPPIPTNLVLFRLSTIPSHSSMRREIQPFVLVVTIKLPTIIARGKRSFRRGIGCGHQTNQVELIAYQTVFDHLGCKEIVQYWQYPMAIAEIRNPSQGENPWHSQLGAPTFLVPPYFKALN